MKAGGKRRHRAGPDRRLEYILVSSLKITLISVKTQFKIALKQSVIELDS